MKKGFLLSFLLIGLAMLLLSCVRTIELKSAADIDNSLNTLEQLVKEGEEVAKSMGSGDLKTVTKVADIAVKYYEQYTALQAVESKMTPEQKERMNRLVARFNKEDKGTETNTTAPEAEQPDITVEADTIDLE